MNKETKLVRIGNSVGVVLPRELLTKLRVELGDTIYWSETGQGFDVRANDPAFVEAMTAAEQVMKEDRDILAVLAR